MTGLEILSNYVNIIILSICLGLGYVIKHSVRVIPNNYIPAVMAVVGIILNIWICKTFTAEVLLTGLSSGLAATGAFEFVRNFKNS
jgi:hypothetical protein